MIAKLVFLFCSLGSIACAVLLVRGYFKDRTRLLLWSGLCFVGIAINNTLLFIDLVMVPDLNFYGSLMRSGLSAASGGILLYGLIWELT